MTLRTIDAFITTVAPDKATVVFSPEFIAIFGSVISLNKRYTKPKSQRDAFYWWLLEKRADLKELLLLPESYNDWSDFSVYSDLLLFEQDLGYLTSAVLIFLESPGSIAELGAFSQIESLSERLIVVVNEDHHPKRSFISLGPLRSIEKTQKHPHCVCVIPSVKPEQLVKHVSVIIDMLEQKRSLRRPPRSFDATNPQHQILLVLDFINLFSVIQIKELQHLATHFGVHLKLQRLNQLLFLLEKTKLIICRHYGGNQYFLPQSFRREYIDYTSGFTSSPFNRATTKTRAWEEVKSDAYRKSVLESAIKGREVK